MDSEEIKYNEIRRICHAFIFSLITGSQKNLLLALHGPKLSALLEDCNTDKATKKFFELLFMFKMFSST